MNLLKKLLSLFLASQMAYGQPPKTEAPVTPEERADILRHIHDAVFIYVVNQSALVRNAQDLDRLVLTSLPEKDRDSIKNELAGMAEIPQIRREGDTLLVGEGRNRIEIQWPDPSKLDFTVNGANFTYVPGKPLLPQIKSLIERLPRKTSLIDSVLPQANAFVIAGSALIVLAITTIIGALIGGVISNALSVIASPTFFRGGWCHFLSWIGKGDKNPDCIAYHQQLDELLYAKYPTFNAIKKQIGANNKDNPLAKYEGRTRVCPSNNDGKPRRFVGSLRPVKLDHNKRVAADFGYWYYVNGEVNPDGTAVQFTFTSSDDNTAPDEVDTKKAKHLVVQAVYNPKNNRPEVFRISDPAQPDETIELKPNMKLSPEQNHLIDETIDRLLFIDHLSEVCSGDDVTTDLVEGKNPGSPIKPVTEPASAAPEK